MGRRINPEGLAAWRQQAIDRMTQSRAATLKFLARLPEREMVRPRTQGQWSIKDVLAHIAAWEEEAVRRLKLIARGRGERIVFYDDMRQANEFNARAVAAARNTSPSPLLRRMARVRQSLIEQLLALPPGSLQETSHRYPVTAWLPEFCWTHERDHLRRIRAWWLWSSG
ncbi:MAG: DinB family protein [Acidobacteria bacterium]|nr:DinB family protein [Acidobacteriota bacterium]